MQIDLFQSNIIHQFDLFISSLIHRKFDFLSSISLSGLQGRPISRENVHEDTNISGEGIF